MIRLARSLRPSLTSPLSRFARVFLALVVCGFAVVSVAPAFAQTRADSKKVDPKKVDPKKADPKKVDPKKVDPKKADSKKAAAKPDPKKPDPKKPDSKKPASGKPGAKAAAGAAAAGAAGAVGAAGAAAVKPALVQSYGEWGVYAAKAAKTRTCYALAKPKERLPASLNRDPAYVFISQRPVEGVRNEVSIIMGFDVKPDGAPKAEIGGAEFSLVAKGANLWVKNAAEEGAFIDALRKGSRLVIKAQSLRGNQTSDTYALGGLGQALDRVTKECQ